MGIDGARNGRSSGLVWFRSLPLAACGQRKRPMLSIVYYSVRRTVPCDFCCAVYWWILIIHLLAYWSYIIALFAREYYCKRCSSTLPR